MTKIRVVLIEDHNLTRLGLRTLLRQRSDIEFVGEAVNGLEGLQLLKTTKSDVAIVDIGLPDLDGIELTRRYKEFGQSRERSPTKILILTLQDNEEAVIAAFAAGADSYCMKNISFDLLVEAIKTTHEGNSWIDPAIARIVLSQVHQTNQIETDTNPETLETAPAKLPKNLLEVYPLTERELQVLQLIVDGKSNAEIGEQLLITIGTVKTHVRNILNKLSADDRTQAAVRALRSGLID
jgi:DNA-binding NarL/FixJ family response regulator